MDQILERFWDKVEVKENGCWIWTANTMDNGYGQFWDGKTRLGAHRFAYRVNKGNIPEGLVIDHLCKNRNCVNPDHMEAVTPKENIQRGENFNRNKTHCKKGHIYEGSNLYVAPNGDRFCRICMRKHWNNTSRKLRGRFNEI